jgi:heme A synthase
VASALLAFSLAVLGSWVRINEAGMTCPDWPLCRGALVPRLVGGVVLEWSHRAVALSVGFFILGAFITGWRLRRSIAGVGRTLIVLVAIFVTQVAVGGWTIKVANSPESVAVHWATAMALLATLTVLSLLSLIAPPARIDRAARRWPVAARLLALAAAFGFVTMCIGSYVSSSHFGLACATVPGCDGTLLGNNAGQLAQMLHRLAALSFFVVGAFATGRAAAGGSPRAGTIAFVALGLVVLQIALGIGNVVMHMPTLLREAHAANAVLSFLAYVIAAFFATLEPAAPRIFDAGIPLRAASTAMASSK